MRLRIAGVKRAAPPEDVDRLHDIWLKLSESVGSRLHHRDVVGMALRLLEEELDNEGARRDRIIEHLRRDIPKSS